MSHRFLHRNTAAIVLALAGFLSGCRGANSTGPVVLTISSLFPAAGSTIGANFVTVSGEGFEAGATVTFGGIAATGVVLSLGRLMLVTPAHTAGAVDVIVTNPSGTSTTRAGGFTYIVPPPPSIFSVSPNRVSSSGGAYTEIDGSFQTGAIATIDGVSISTYVSNSLIFAAHLSAHPAGIADLVVTNPDGQKVTRGFTFAPPAAFDFNGTWDGYQSDNDALIFRFTIANNLLTSLTCGTSTPFVPLPSPQIVDGAFSFSSADGASVSGRIVADAQAIGAINLPVCGALTWYAERHQ